ncbi:MAG: hypothetical protein JKY01_00585 [Pseudomonadales bacterium]|nr:hypothetical protein [Pseudomonadales bacterium]
MKKVLSCCLLALVCFGTVHAGTVSQWNLPDGKMFTLSYEDKQHVLIELGKGHKIIVNGAKNHLLTRQGGQLIAMDLAQVGGALQAFGGRMMQKSQQRLNDLKGSKVQFKKTKRIERIGGYRGEVYEVYLKSPKGDEQHEIVVSKHPDILAMQEIFLEMSKRASKVAPSNHGLGTMNYFSKQAKSVGIGGVLRYGSDLVLRQVEKKTLRPETFQLPQGVMLISMPVFPSMVR